MFPNIELFGKVLSWYMITALCGILTVLYFTYKTAQKQKLDPFNMLYLVLFAFIGVFFGGHILYGITNIAYWPLYFKNLFSFGSFGKFIDATVAVFGGQVFYGGLLGGLAVGAVYAHKKHFEMRYIDIAACAVPLFHTFGRIGCFLGGCCYGVESPFGFVYHYSPIESANGVTRFPVQLAEAAFNLCLFFVLYALLKKGKLYGKLLWVYLGSYAAARFGLEFLRGDELRGHWGALSTSQIISLLILTATACAAAVYAVRRKKQAKP